MIWEDILHLVLTFPGSDEGDDAETLAGMKNCESLGYSLKLLQRNWNIVQCSVWNAHHPQEFVTIRAHTLGGKLVRAGDAWEAAPLFLVFRCVSRCFITAYEFIDHENLEIQRNL
ncbi:hypothetical protein Y032_1113g3626 [Ancylostoma ceylanicum]|uniref:Uncharacterized protein n=1 Tax=Ancylostoma ceylanicum TaxID=53326 RepID=A0A016W879_9BILA|nr:hypothetical protein Y032_1113g3626 [Ancylostoma ceylanicum]